jgi:hypothetical protein
MNLKYAAAVAAMGIAAAFAAPAMSQSPSIKPFPLDGATASATTGVKIAVTYQFFIEGRTQTMANQASLADQGRKHLYLMLAKECVVLKETIADTCSIERASVNAQLRQRSRRKNSGVRISGSASYRIVLKKDQK